MNLNHEHPFCPACPTHQSTALCILPAMGKAWGGGGKTADCNGDPRALMLSSDYAKATQTTSRLWRLLPNVVPMLETPRGASHRLM